MINRAPWISYVIITVLAAIDALVSIILIYPNNFAPVGIQGFTVMIQHLLGISVGYLYVFVNAPMLIAAFFVLKKSYSLKNLSIVFAEELGNISAKVQVSGYKPGQKFDKAVFTCPVRDYKDAEIIDLR